MELEKKSMKQLKALCKELEMTADDVRKHGHLGKKSSWVKALGDHIRRNGFSHKSIVGGSVVRAHLSRSRGYRLIVYDSAGDEMIRYNQRSASLDPIVRTLAIIENEGADLKVEVRGAKLLEEFKEAMHLEITAKEIPKGKRGWKSAPIGALTAVHSNLTTFAQLADLAELNDILVEEEPKMIAFIPTNEAFDEIPPEMLEQIVADEDMLKSILMNHMVGLAPKYRSGFGATILNENLPTMSGDIIQIVDDDIVEGDIIATNGTLHIINKVLIPESAGFDIVPSRASRKNPSCYCINPSCETCTRNPNQQMYMGLVENPFAVVRRNTLAHAAKAFATHPKTRIAASKGIEIAHDAIQKKVKPSRNGQMKRLLHDYIEAVSDSEEHMVEMLSELEKGTLKLPPINTMQKTVENYRKTVGEHAEEAASTVRDYIPKPPMNNPHDAHGWKPQRLPQKGNFTDYPHASFESAEIEINLPGNRNPRKLRIVKHHDKNDPEKCGWTASYNDATYGRQEAQSSITSKWASQALTQWGYDNSWFTQADKDFLYDIGLWPSSSEGSRQRSYHHVRESDGWSMYSNSPHWQYAWDWITEQPEIRRNAYISRSGHVRRSMPTGRRKHGGFDMVPGSWKPKKYVVAVLKTGQMMPDVVLETAKRSSAIKYAEELWADETDIRPADSIYEMVEVDCPSDGVLIWRNGEFQGETSRRNPSNFDEKIRTSIVEHTPTKPDPHPNYWEEIGGYKKTLGTIAGVIDVYVAFGQDEGRKHGERGFEVGTGLPFTGEEYPWSTKSYNVDWETGAYRYIIDEMERMYEEWAKSMNLPILDYGSGDHDLLLVGYVDTMANNEEWQKYMALTNCDHSNYKEKVADVEGDQYLLTLECMDCGKLASGQMAIEWARRNPSDQFGILAALKEADRAIAAGLKKSDCCCGATIEKPCKCMYEGIMKCSSAYPMCPCYAAKHDFSDPRRNPSSDWWKDSKVLSIHSPYTGAELTANGATVIWDTVGPYQWSDGRPMIYFMRLGGRVISDKISDWINTLGYEIAEAQPGGVYVYIDNDEKAELDTFLGYARSYGERRNPQPPWPKYPTPEDRPWGAERCRHCNELFMDDQGISRMSMMSCRKCPRGKREIVCGNCALQTGTHGNFCPEHAHLARRNPMTDKELAKEADKAIDKLHSLRGGVRSKNTAQQQITDIRRKIGNLGNHGIELAPLGEVKKNYPKTVKVLIDGLKDHYAYNLDDSRRNPTEFRWPCGAGGCNKKTNELLECEFCQSTYCPSCAAKVEMKCCDEPLGQFEPHWSLFDADTGRPLKSSGSPDWRVPRSNPMTIHGPQAKSFKQWAKEEEAEHPGSSFVNWASDEAHEYKNQLKESPDFGDTYHNKEVADKVRGFEGWISSEIAEEKHSRRNPAHSFASFCSEAKKGTKHRKKLAEKHNVPISIVEEINRYANKLGGSDDVDVAQELFEGWCV